MYVFIERGIVMEGQGSEVLGIDVLGMDLEVCIVGR